MKQELMKELGDCMMNVLFATNQLHYIHWLTKKNHHHVVIGETYDELSEELDSLVEQYLGAMSSYKVPELLPVPSKPFQYAQITKEQDILSYLDNISARLQKGLSIVEKEPKLKFMVDSLSDMLAIVYGAKYQIQQE